MSDQFHFIKYFKLYFFEYRNKRRNQLVCDIFSRLDFMERRGSGIKKIFQAYENDEKKPKFEIIDDVFIVTFYSRLYSDKTSEKHPKNIQKFDFGIY